MIIDQGEDVQVPFVDDFSPKYLDLWDDVILYRRVRNLRRGDVEYLHVGLK